MLTRSVNSIFKRTLVQYIFKSPNGELTPPPVTVDQYVWQNISKWEDKTSVECGLTGRRLTYKELRSKTKSLATSLASLGLSGGTALVVMPNCVEYPVAILGSIEAGVTTSLANPVYTPDELKTQALDSGANAIITDPSCLDKVLLTKLGLPIICTGDVQTGDGIHSFKQMVECSAKETVLQKPEDRMDQLVCIPYSSGTTGLPKGVMLSHRNLVSILIQTSHKNVNPTIEPTANQQDTIPAVLPFFHIYGFSIILLRSLAVGIKIITLPKFDPHHFINIFRNNKDIVLYAVPPMISFLGKSPDVKAEDLQSLRYTICGAAPCGEADLNTLQEKRQHPAVQGYGMTEGPVLTFTHKGCKERATVGPTLSGTLGKVIDIKSGESLPPGQQGELCFKGPQVMKGYLNRPDATSETIDGEGWLHTGDIGYADSEGKFYVVDRLKELIKVKGFQVAPAELEALLRQHPDIIDVGVTSVPSEITGESPVAFVVPKPGEPLDITKVSEWVGGQVAPYKRLGRIICVSEIPKSASGKILRRKLKEIAKKEVKID